RNGKTVTYTARNGLVNDHVVAVYADPQGAVWVGTMSGGLNRIRDGRITSWSADQGLFDDTVGNILEDDFGNLWISCDRGVFRVSKRELNDYAAGRVRSIHSLAFGTGDGMRSRECIYGGTGLVGGPYVRQLAGAGFERRAAGSGCGPPGDPVHGAELRGGLAHPVPLSPGRFRQGMDRSRRPPDGLLYQRAAGQLPLSSGSRGERWRVEREGRRPEA